jgi:hypothetical protein
LKRFLTLSLVLAIALPATAVAADPPAPTHEQVQLRKADVKLARKVTVQRKDLAAGWKKSAPGEGGGEGSLTCDGYAPDFSAFTITGRAESGFEHESGARIDSSVAVFKSNADAAGDFQTGTGPGFVECFRTTLEQEFADVTDVKITVVSANAMPAPKVGQRSYAAQIVALVEADGNTVNVFIDLVIVQKGRTVTMLFFTNGLESMPGQAVLARRIAARMR